MRFYSHIDKAASTSTYTEGELQDTFAADKALSLGSGYWCSTGKHTASEVISYAGELKHRKKVSGVKVFWAYAPGKVQIRTSPDGAHWSTVIPFHASPRAEVTYEQNLLFDKQRNVKKISVDMTNPRPWGVVMLPAARVPPCYQPGVPRVPWYPCYQGHRGHPWYPCYQ
eukprot:g13294.t1